MVVVVIVIVVFNLIGVFIIHAKLAFTKVQLHDDKIKWKALIASIVNYQKKIHFFFIRTFWPLSNYSQGKGSKNPFIVCITKENFSS